MITASVNGDGKVVEFDVTPWFDVAEDDDILALYDDEWYGEAAQEIVTNFPSKNLKVQYAKGKLVSVNEDEAIAWLKEHKPKLWQIIDNGD